MSLLNFKTKNVGILDHPFVTVLSKCPWRGMARICWPSGQRVADPHLGGSQVDGNGVSHCTDGSAESGEEDRQGDVFWSCHASYGKAVRHLDLCVALITCSCLCWAFLALILFKEEWWKIRPTCRNPWRHHDPSSFCLLDGSKPGSAVSSRSEALHGFTGGFGLLVDHYG